MSFAALIGVVFLTERFGPLRVVAAIMIAAGIVPISAKLDAACLTPDASRATGLLASRLMTEQIYVGNAAADAPANRGWLLGHFMSADDARHSHDVEVKWAIHPQGDQRLDWVAGEQRSAMLFLISGRFRVELPDRSVLLARQGDYVVLHRVSHSWHAEQDSVVLAVRWPSIPGYAAPDEQAHGQIHDRSLSSSA